MKIIIEAICLEGYSTPNWGCWHGKLEAGQLEVGFYMVYFVNNE